jgi:hypothetical protein
MDDPGAFYAISLHTPRLRETLTREPEGPRRRLLSPRVAELRRGLARGLRAVAARLDAPHVAGGPLPAPAR